PARLVPSLPGSTPSAYGGSCMTTCSCRYRLPLTDSPHDDRQAWAVIDPAPAVAVGVHERPDEPTAHDAVAAHSLDALACAMRLQWDDRCARLWDEVQSRWGDVAGQHVVSHALSPPLDGSWSRYSGQNVGTAAPTRAPRCPAVSVVMPGSSTASRNSSSTVTPRSSTSQMAVPISTASALVEYGTPISVRVSR